MRKTRLNWERSAIPGNEHGDLTFIKSNSSWYHNKYHNNNNSLVPWAWWDKSCVLQENTHRRTPLRCIRQCQISRFKCAIKHEVLFFTFWNRLNIGQNANMIWILAYKWYHFTLTPQQFHTLYAAFCMTVSPWWHNIYKHSFD